MKLYQKNKGSKKKKKVLLQVMGAVLVAGLMAGCGGTNDTKTEENTKTEAAADNADAKEEPDSTEAEDTSEDSASTDSAEEDRVQRQMTQLQKQRVQVRILQVVIQQKQTVQRWPTARRQKQQEVLLVQQPRLQTVSIRRGCFCSRMEYYSRRCGDQFLS